MRTKKNTKGRYLKCNAAARLWFVEHHPECVDADGEIEIPLPTAACIEFLASICRRGYERNRRNVAPSAELNAEISKVVVGYQKLLNELKKRGLFKITEGKQPLMSAGYHMLAEKLLSYDPRTRKVGAQASTASFAWAFFRDDSLVIQEQGHKGDQTRTEKYWKHIYANPHKPEVLALAVLVFAGAPRANTDRLGKTLHQILWSLTEGEKQTLAQERADIGPYSLRKGSASYCLGQVNDAYFFQGDGQDQLCGRMVSGLPFNDETFATAFPYLLASIIFHEDYL
ncbi:hypothetical protein B484DRAFT_341876, partial [Ochromonadaceae sp. CCMP2298]